MAINPINKLDVRGTASAPVALQMKINSVLTELMLKTDSANVIVDNATGETLEERLNSLAAGGNMTPDQIEDLINEAINNLVDGAPEALDTLKEIADYIEENRGDLTALSADLEALNARLSDVEEKLDNMDFDFPLHILDSDESTDGIADRELIVRLLTDDTSVTATDATTLAAAFADPDVKTITVVGTIQADDSDFVCELTEGEKTLNLASGASIIAKSDDADSTAAAIVVTPGAKLTINADDTCKIDGGENCDNNIAVWARGGDVVINGGCYDVGWDDDGEEGSGNSTIYASASNGVAGNIEIYGGTFTNRGTNALGGTKYDSYFVLNINNNVGCTITCYGGKYLNQNPADGDDKDTTTGATFLATGCSVSEEETDEGTWYTVS